MLRIKALNDEEDPALLNDDENIVRKEAQETIVESEYMRAMHLKCNGKTKACLNLLDELLQTQILSDISKESDKLWIIKYNCHKNIAMILEEMGEHMMALQNYSLAVQIDDSDNYTMFRYGMLAQKCDAYDLAEYAFESCLARNSAHWRAAEGLLNARCANRNVLGAQYLAQQMKEQFPDYVDEMPVYKEIEELFEKNMLPKLRSDDDMLPGSLVAHSGPMEFKCFKVKKDVYSSEMQMQDEQKEKNYVKSVIKKYAVHNMNWLELGEFIVKVSEDFKNDGRCVYFDFVLDDIMHNESAEMEEEKTADVAEKNLTMLVVENKAEAEVTATAALDSKPTEDNNNAELINGDATAAMDSNAEQQPATNVKFDGLDSNKSKPRRRCSDLQFLEQWGWHKRRYSTRKKNEREEVNTNLNGFLRKLLSKYAEKSYENKWPFNEEDNAADAVDVECEQCKESYTDEEFQLATQHVFDKFLAKNKTQKLDLSLLAYRWLKYMGQCWTYSLPTALKNTYIEVFKIYASYYDFTNWNQLNDNNLQSSFRLCLLFLELCLKEKFNEANFDLWQTIFNQLIFHSHVMHEDIEDDGTDRPNRFLLRLIYLQYLLLNYQDDFQECIACIDRILEMLNREAIDSAYKLHLPNLPNGHCLHRLYLENLRKQFERQIDTNKITELHKQGNWTELVRIITNNVQAYQNSSDDDDNWLRDFRIEMKLLLKSLWQLTSFDSCLIWCEKFLHYAVCHYLDDEQKSTYQQNLFSDMINYISSYIEAAILNEGSCIVSNLTEDSLSRMVQNIIRLLVYQFEGGYEKGSTIGLEINFKQLWVILHQLVVRQENDSPEMLARDAEPDDVADVIPNSFLILFTAHEYVGKRQWCTNDNGVFLEYILDTTVQNFKAPIYDACRDMLYEYIEQVTYCLFKYPQKRARLRHLEDHDVQQVMLNWNRGVLLFDLYRPEDLPEFNSYKLESITSDMEQLLLKVITLMPRDLDPTKCIHNVTNFVDGQTDSPPEDLVAFKLPFKIKDLFYLLADFYFKSRDFSKAIKYYTMDLTTNTQRFDSWAGMALSKASKIETKLNGLDAIDTDTLWTECEEVLRCFECCINLNRFQTLLWIEYGNFTYTLHSYFSRYLKSGPHNANVPPEKLAIIEERKSKTLTISHNCFLFASSLQNTASKFVDPKSDGNDEKWLCQYMLGKISEKRKEDPKIYLNYYLLASNLLYENNATYPIKLNHNNPTNLSVEALEVFYRTNAAIIKFIEQAPEVSRANGTLFRKVLKNLAKSAFAFNKAKIDGNSLNMLKAAGKTTMKLSGGEAHRPKEASTAVLSNETATLEQPVVAASAILNLPNVVSSDSSTIESDSESSESSREGDSAKLPNTTCPVQELNNIYGLVVQNIEECVTRFPEHYKSIYRLVNHFINPNSQYCDLVKTEQLILGQYRTSLGNLINGLFFDRRNNNLFNGIWRIPSSEIDRPGNFATHLVKCVRILIMLLTRTNNHMQLINIAFTLHRTPDSDKRYITDGDRKELHQMSITNCVNILRAALDKNIAQRDDSAALQLLLDIYKIHKKCLKYMNQREPLFTQLIVDAYKHFIKDKVDFVPENLNYLDLAIKLCLQEISLQKTTSADHNMGEASDFIVMQSSSAPTSAATGPLQRPINIPGLSMRMKNRSTVPQIPTSLYNSIATLQPGGIGLPYTPFLPGMENADFQSLFNSYYMKLLQNEQQKQFATAATSQATTSQPAMNFAAKSFFDLSNPAALTSSTTQAYNLTAKSENQSNALPSSSNLTNTTTVSSNKTAVIMSSSQAKAGNARKTKVNPYSRSNTDTQQMQTTNQNQNQANSVIASYANLYQNCIPKAFSQADFSSNTDVSTVSRKTKTPTMNIAEINVINPIAAASSSAAVISPTKTLQQKLAERQKACQMKESKSNQQRPPSRPPATDDDDDSCVIILD